jgi:hypothetical protein
LEEARALGVDIRLRQNVQALMKDASGFVLEIKDQGLLRARCLLLATGSSPAGYAWAEQLGHTIQPPVPSLFTFNVPNSALKELSGIALEKVCIQIKDTPLVQTGPLLITHFGFSGPAILKLSAWGARYLHDRQYCAEILINWLPTLSEEEIFQVLSQCKTNAPQKRLSAEPLFSLPKNLWRTLVEQDNASSKRMGDISLKELRALARKLHADVYSVEGKTTHKEEFVTCGGVTLKEIDFKTMQSKICPGLFFAGEILDIDGITGGFNFQNAWTTAFLVGSAI